MSNRTTELLKTLIETAEELGIDLMNADGVLDLTVEVYDSIQAPTARIEGDLKSYFAFVTFFKRVGGIEICTHKLKFEYTEEEDEYIKTMREDVA